MAETNKKLWSNLPSSDVEEDGDPMDSRVPTFGLHMQPDDLPWGSHTTGTKGDSSRCDSGIFDSGLSTMSGESSVRSSFADSEEELRGQMKAMNIDQHRLSGTAQFKAAERLPSVDEGFWSKEGDSLRSVTTETTTETTSSSPQVSQPEHLVTAEDSVDRIVDIFLQDEDGDTKLHMAIIQMLPAVAVQMINLCPDSSLLGIQNTLGQSPLHLAVYTHQANIVRYLVSRGASLEQRDRNGNTPLHLACREGDLHCVQALTLPLTTSEMTHAAYSADVQCIPQNMDLWNYEGETCLHLAQLKGHRTIIAYLISPHVQANVNVKDGRSGRTVLHYAVESGDVDAVRFLLHHCQANVNAATFDGSTPLKLALGRGLGGAAGLLVQCGADPAPVTSSEESDSSSSEDEEMYDDIHIGGQPIST